MRRHRNVASVFVDLLCKFRKLIFQTQNSGLNRLDELFAGNIESYLVFELAKKLLPVTIALYLEMKHRVNHRLINDAESAILLPFFVVGAINSVTLEVKLQTE